MKYRGHYEKAQKIPVGSKAEGDALIAKTLRDRPRSHIAVYVESRPEKSRPANARANFGAGYVVFLPPCGN